jgi:hypothetical protein
MQLDITFSVGIRSEQTEHYSSVKSLMKFAEALLDTLQNCAQGSTVN